VSDKIKIIVNIVTWYCNMVLASLYLFRLIAHSQWHLMRIFPISTRFLW